MMDLGKMLAEALDATPGPNMWARDNYEAADLTAAAEAFLAKVREAEDEENRRRHPRGAVTISPANGGEAWMMNGVLSYPSPGAAFDAWMAASEPPKERPTPREVFDDTKARYPNIMDRLAESERKDDDHTGPVPFYGDVE
jgi:hypothetical protein